MKIQNTLTNLYILLLLPLLSLSMHDGFFDITVTKYTVFMSISSLYLCLSVIHCIYSYIQDKTSFKDKINKQDSILWIMIFVFLLSSLFSKYPSFIGNESRYQGFLSIFVYLLVMLFISKSTIKESYMIRIIQVVYCIVSIIAILNYYSFDVLGILTPLSLENKRQFISTIGNIDFYGSYIALLYPFVFVSYIYETKYEILSFIVFIISSLSIYSCGSDGFLLGLGVLFVLFPIFVLKDRKLIQKTIFSYLSIVLLGLICKGILSMYGSNYEENIIMIMFSNLVLVGIVCSILLVLFILSFKIELYAYRKIYYGFIIVLGVGILSLCIYINVMKVHIFDDLFLYSDTWGHNRGKIWTYCLETYKHYSIKDKVLGVGCDCLKYITIPSHVFHKVINASHNEYLNYLMCTGIVGLGSYISVLCLVFVRGKKYISNPFVLSLVFGVVSFLLQASVNIAQPNTTPLLFVFMGMILSRKGECYEEDVTVK